MSQNDGDQEDQRVLSIRAIEDVVAAVHAAALTAEQFLARPASGADASFSYRKSQADVAVSVLAAAPAILGALISLDNHGTISSSLRPDSRWKAPSKS